MKTVRIAWAPDGSDFNDILRAGAGGIGGIIASLEEAQTAVPASIEDDNAASREYIRHTAAVSGVLRFDQGVISCANPDAALRVFADYVEFLGSKVSHQSFPLQAAVDRARARARNAHFIDLFGADAIEAITKNLAQVPAGDDASEERNSRPAEASSSSAATVGDPAPKSRPRRKAAGDGGDPPHHGIAPAGGDGGDPRPIIKLIGGDLPQIVDQAEAALIASNPDFYRYGGQLVRPVVEEVPAADMTRTQAHRLVPVTRAHLVDVLTLAVRFQRFDRRTKKWLDVDCPDRIAETYLAREGAQHLPPLVGVIGAPMLRADGSLLDQQGYDARTGLLFRSDAQFEDVPDSPTREDARRALALLRDLVSTFPFNGPADQSVALSGILTAIDRRAVPAAPIHAITAPVAGSGKSLIVDLISLIANGRRAQVLDQSKDDVETDKRLVAALMRGSSQISIDNIDRPLDSALLCQASSTPGTMQLRVLGSSRDIEVPNTAMFLATGNNLVLAGDLTRRSLISRLDPGCERPELREFNCDPAAMVRQDRPRYVKAALTILRAYFIAAEDDRVKVTPLGSYEAWSRRVREALIWLDCADPCETMATARRADPITAALSALIAAWRQAVGVGKPVAVQAVVEMANRIDLGGRHAYPELREAILAIAGDHREINVFRLAKWLSKNEDRVIDRHRIVRAGTHSGTIRWAVTEV